MALNFVTDQVFGERIKEDVVIQLRKRQEILSRRVERTPDDILYLTATAPWVRITSSVNVIDDEGPKNARKFQLFRGIGSATKGFVPTEDPDASSYREDLNFGYVPIPGLTDFQVNTKGDYGTLRTATFSFTAHSPEDFSKLEQLYLRPGFSILLEWGHSMKVDNNGEVNSNFNYYPLDDFTSPSNIDDISNKLLELRAINSYNYDAMFGFIKNFSWNYNGISYVCTVDVVSKGELIEALQATFAPVSKTNDKVEQVGFVSTTFGSDVEKVLNLIKTAPIENYFQGGNSSNAIDSAIQEVKALIDRSAPEYSSAFTDFKLIAGGLGGSSSSRTSKLTRYIRLKEYLKVLNIGSLLYDQDGANIIKFYTGGERQTPFTTFPGHIGLDPGVCILPKVGRDSDFFIPFSTQTSVENTDDILNIFISVDFILELYAKAREESERKYSTLFSLLKQLLSGIQKNLGGINLFTIAYDDEDGMHYVLDTQVIPSRTDYENGDNNIPKSLIDLVGLKSEVENLQVTSKLTNDLGSLIAIAAQASSDPAAQLNIQNVQQWNEGLIDRHVERKSFGITGTVREEQTTSTSELKTKYAAFLQSIAYRNPYYIAYDKDAFQGYSEIHRKLTREKLQELIEGRTNPSGLIPFELSFTIKGISGIKVLQTFLINDFFLPDRYRGKVAFIVTNVDHKITSGRWVTDIVAKLTLI